MFRFISFVLLILALFVENTLAMNISMNTASEAFGGELLEGPSTTNVGVILFHGRGQDPVGDVVGQLRVSINNKGYTTLSIESPIPSSNSPSFDDYLAEEELIDNRVAERLIASINELFKRNNNINTVVLVGFSMGSRFATFSAAAWDSGFLTNLPPGVKLAGLIGAGMYDNIRGGTPTISPPSSLDDLNVYDTINNLALVSSIPALDIYGDLDLGASDTYGFATSRASAFSGNYTQTALNCPDFNNATYYARFREGFSDVVLYDLNKCHQLRNGFLTEADAFANNTPDVITRGSATAPLESTVDSWMAIHTPLTPPQTVTYNQTTVGLTVEGETLSNISIAAATGTKPSNITTPYGQVSYQVTSPPKGLVKVRIVFSTPLPASFILYKVDGNGNYTPIPESTGVDGFWVKVGTNSLDITLKDNGVFDLNNAEGIIEDPFALAVIAASNIPTMSVWSLFLLSVLIGIYGFKFRNEKIVE